MLACAPTDSECQELYTNGIDRTRVKQCSGPGGGWLLQYETYSQVVAVDKGGGGLLQYEMYSLMVAVEKKRGRTTSGRKVQPGV